MEYQFDWKEDPKNFGKWNTNLQLLNYYSYLFPELLQQNVVQLFI